MASTPPTDSSDHGAQSCSPNKIPDSILDTDKSSDQRAMEKALRLIEDSYRGRPVPAYPTYRFQDKRSYEKLSQNLRHCGLLPYFRDSLRKDWNAITGELTLRLIPGTLHEAVASALAGAIEKKLDKLVKKHKFLRTARGKITRLGPAGADNKTAEHDAFVVKSPEAQFWYEGTRAAPFIIEVSCIQQTRLSAENIGDYLTFLGAEAVLVIDIEYAPRENPWEPHHVCRATFVLWTAETTDDGIVIGPQAVLRAIGPSSREYLAIPFKLFLPPSARTGKPDEDRELRFSCEHLAQIVRASEGTRHSRGTTPPTRSAKRIRRIIHDVNGALVANEMVDLMGPATKRQKTT